MRIDTYNLQKAYNLNGLSNGIKPNSAIKNVANQGDKFADSLSSLNRNKIITGAERKFFVNMFPESSKQLMTHEVFTRNGRIQSSAIEKGTLIDGKI